MFIGTYKTEVTDGRVLIPLAYRADFAHGGVITKGLEQILYLYPKKEWGILAKNLSSLSFTNKVARQLQRHMMGGGEEVALVDGSVTIPDHLRTYADITDVIIIAGTGNRVEMSNEEIWAQALSGSAEELSESLSSLSFAL